MQLLICAQRIKIEAALPLETVIDPEGDLRLVVGPDEHSIIVSSKILRVASTVFKEKLSVFEAPVETASRFLRHVSPGLEDGTMYVQFLFLLIISEFLMISGIP